MRRLPAFLLTAWMIFWRALLAVLFLSSFSTNFPTGLLTNLSILGSLGIAAFLVYRRGEYTKPFPIFRRLFSRGDFTTPIGSSKVRPSSGATPKSWGSNNRRPRQTGYEPQKIQGWAIPSGHNVFGTPGAGLSNSGFNQTQVELGQKGEEAFAKVLGKTGLINNFDSFWSVAMPSRNTMTPDRKLSTDIDCILAFDNTILLVDTKYYKGGDVTYQSVGDRLHCFDSTGNLVSPPTRMTRNMEAAYDRMSTHFPNHQIYAFVVFIPTERGAPGLNNVVWPGNIPGVSLVDLISYLESSTSTGYRSDRKVQREIRNLL